MAARTARRMSVRKSPRATHSVSDRWIRQKLRLTTCDGEIAFKADAPISDSWGIHLHQSWAPIGIFDPDEGPNTQGPCVSKTDMVETESVLSEYSTTRVSCVPRSR